jgi:hypothetical protein
MFLPNLVTILTINVQIVGNDEYLILDIKASWQGANHDARIWENSNVKTVIERQRQYLVAGDSGYPISDVLMKPYPNRRCSPTCARQSSTASSPGSGRGLHRTSLAL